MEAWSAEVHFPDGTVVRAASLAACDHNAGWRDYGLYLDERWQPAWPAWVVAWPDFGVPSDAHEAKEAIVQAYERAQAGERVEIGCAGGMGRTGTVLACLAILAGVEDDEAVAWVRRHYHEDAVETPAQEHWVREFTQAR